MSPAVPNDDFFIGWLKMMPGYQRAIRAVVLPAFVFGALVAMALALLQQSPGTGAWEDEREQTIDGVAYVAPYPMLRAIAHDERGASTIRTIFLVEEGKHGATDRVREFDGRSVRATGTLLHRDDRWMLELASGDRGLRALESGAGIATRQSVRLGSVTLTGEIIDPKCYLGAMKPGGGKTHKACAALCIRGGIPPMLVTRDEQRQETFYLLTDAAGRPLGEVIVPFIGDQVELTGELERIDDLLLLKIDSAPIRRR
jgi:hypothetical protein